MAALTELDYGMPTVFGRGLYDEFKCFVNHPFLVVTMQDLWPLFSHHFEGASYHTYFCKSLEQVNLETDINHLPECRAIVGMGGGQALDVAKYFAWRLNVPLFQAPTALSVNAVYGQRSGIRRNGQVFYIGWAVPQSIFIDYDVLASCPRQLNWSGIGDILCFHTGVLDWLYADTKGTIEAKWPYNQELADQSLDKVKAVIKNADNIHAMNELGIDTLVDGLKWGTTYHGAGWCPRHIEGTEHFVFYTLEKFTGTKFLHGQPVGLGIIVALMMHEKNINEILEPIVRIGLDIRPEAMGISWKQVEEALVAMRNYVNEVGLWHSIAHDTTVTSGFVADLKKHIDTAYAHRKD